MFRSKDNQQLHMKSHQNKENNDGRNKKLWIRLEIEKINSFIILLRTNSNCSQNIELNVEVYTKFTLTPA